MKLFRQAFISGSIASVLSAAVLMWAGRRERRRPAAPVNAISHWFYGDAALRKDEPNLRHTLVGFAIHHAASVFWAALHAWAWRRRDEPVRPAKALASATATAGVACFVDYRLTPRRFTPGFEHRLSRPALAGVYAAFAIGLAAGTLLAAGPLKRR